MTTSRSLWLRLGVQQARMYDQYVACLDIRVGSSVFIQCVLVHAVVQVAARNDCRSAVFLRHALQGNQQAQKVVILRTEKGVFIVAVPTDGRACSGGFSRQVGVVEYNLVDFCVQQVRRDRLKRLFR